MAKQLSVLDAPLQRISPHDVYLVRDAVTHKIAFGTTGSGKTSTTFKQEAIAALRLGAGAMFCVAKPEDAEAIRQWCAEAGRLESLIEVNEQRGSFNDLAHELARTGSINAVIDVLMAKFEIVRSSASSPGKAGDQFWQDSPQQMFRALVGVVYAAERTVTTSTLLAAVRSTPSSPEELHNPEWQARSPFARLFVRAGQNLEVGPILGFTNEDGQRAMDYWEEFSRLDPKTQGNIRISVTTMLSRFETGILRDFLCTGTSVVPELMFFGAVILLNFPVQVYGEDGAILQKSFKLAAYRTILSRNALPPAMRERPIFIGADEAQNFLVGRRDAEFLAQCRSSRAMVMFATQSLPTLYAKIGGDHPHDATHHLLSNFNTIVLHSSSCAETNEWFARKLGRTLHMRQNISRGEGGGNNFGATIGESTQWGVNSSFGSSSSSGSGGSSHGSNSSSGTSSGGGDNWGRNRGRNTSWNTGESWSEQNDWVIEPGFFARGLLTGGTANRGRVTAIMFRAGANFAATNSNFLMVEYQQ